MESKNLMILQYATIFTFASFAGFACPLAREDLPSYSRENHRQLNGGKPTAVHFFLPGHNSWPASDFLLLLLFFAGSIDWFKGKNTGQSYISWENLWFPVKSFP